MKRNISLIMIIIAAAALVFACNNKKDEASTSKTVSPASVEEKTIHIGVSQFVQHPALDAVYKGIVDGMTSLGYDNIEYDYQNSNADPNTAMQIASLFNSKKKDMVVGIATTNSQALKSGTHDIPVIYAAITDPVSAGLVESLDKGDPGITGTSYNNPFKEQIEFLTSFHDVKVLGQVYTGGEANALFQAKQVEKACAELGIKYIGTSIASSAEVKSATESIINRVDAIYVTNDNTVVSALGGLVDTAIAHKIPVLSADTSSAKDNPVFIAWGFDWYYIGQQTAVLMDKVLKGEKPEDMPTTVISDPSHMNMMLNKVVADEIGIEFPEEVLKQAKTVITE
ncbi:MAG: ABC transporter substrate-binding protein [Spirochaetales bacterium]|nr:ABC transporter substrate-binding protein [Spirochaetales bacterium]